MIWEGTVYWSTRSSLRQSRIFTRNSTLLGHHCQRGTIPSADLCEEIISLHHLFISSSSSSSSCDIRWNFWFFFFFNSFLLRDNTPLMLLLFHLIETERWKKYSMGEWLRNTEWPVTYLSSYLGHPTPPSRGRDWISPERGDNEEYELYPRRTYSVIPLSQNWTYFMKDSTSEGIVYFMWERGLRAGIYKDPISFWFFFLDWLDIFSLISFMYLWILTCVCMYHSIYDVSSMEVWNYYSTSSHLTIMHRITVYRSICV